MNRKTYEVKTVEEAKQLAVADFGVKESELTFTIINEKKGFLGIGSKIEVEAVLDADGITRGKEYIHMILSNNNIQGFIEKRVRGDNVEFNTPIYWGVDVDRTMSFYEAPVKVKLENLYRHALARPLDQYTSIDLRSMRKEKADVIPENG